MRDMRERGERREERGEKGQDSYVTSFWFFYGLFFFVFGLLSKCNLIYLVLVFSTFWFLVLLSIFSILRLIWVFFF